MSLPRLQEFPRSAYPPRAARVADRIGKNRTAPNARGWGALASTSSAQAAKNVRITITRPRDGKTWTPRVMRDLAPLAQLLVDLTSDIGRHAGFEFRGAQEVQGGIGSFVMRDIRGGTAPSWHSWNVALDLMTKGSPRSSTWRSCIPPWMVDLWESAGWGWGGRWTNPFDPHHFEYLYRPQDVAGDMQRARAAAERIRRQFAPPEEDMSREDVLLVQRTMNAIDVRDRNGRRLVEDGLMGPLTRSALEGAPAHVQKQLAEREAVIAQRRTAYIEQLGALENSGSELVRQIRATRERQ